MSTRMYVCESAEHPVTLLSSLNEQRLKGLLCDASVRVQGHIFKAHINVLASSMGYFRDLYITSGKEKPREVIEIPMIVNSTGFAKILDFVYTSQLCLSQSTVMQVLCSACYLQIPYVVEKCQEFITTHGHVTSPASLSEVAAPILQGLQNNGFPKLPANQSASASLSFFSQLNRMSEKSRIRHALQQQVQKKTNLNETEDQQECSLINTPPSPANRSPIGGDRTSPTNQEPKDLSGSGLQVALPLPRETEVGLNDGKITNSPLNKFSAAVMNPDNEGLTKNFLPNWNPDLQRSRDYIDHKSLADYFSTPDREKLVSDVISAYSFPLNGYHTGDVTKQTSQSKASTNERSFEPSLSNNQKKERPKKEYRCDYCGKMFGRQQHLKRHILTHTGERPYPCKYCEKRFRRSEHLKHHLANHEQQMGLEPTVKRKKARKPARADDAYAMSKLMLGQYGNLGPKPTPAVTDSETVFSGPVVLPSMYMDPEPVNNSLSAAASETDDNNAPPGEHTDNQQGSPYSEQSPMAALNLCRDPVKDESAASPMQAESAISDDIDRNFDDRKPLQSDQASTGSRSPNDCMENFNENTVNGHIIGMEKSEVVTYDFQRLIAAFNN